MNRFVTIKDFEEVSKEKLAKAAYGYYSSGADDEHTLKQNIRALQKIRLNPRVLVDMSKFSMRTKILGRQVSLPFGIAPTAMHKLAHPDGEKIVARAAYQKDLCLTISNLSTVPLADIARQNKTGLRLMQLYILKNRSYTETLVRMSEANGFAGLVVTVDAQVFGKRIIDVKNMFSPDTFELQVFKEVGKGKMRFRQNDEAKFHQSFVGNLDVTLDWSAIEWLRKITKLPIILKGIMCVEDALKANSLGVNAIWISNHGGRQLDTVLAPCQALPKISNALRKAKSTMEVYADGGVLKGTDIFKMLALGADYVFIGRGILYSIVEGYEGVKKALNIYESELKTAMMLCGTRNVQEINETYLAELKNPRPRL